MENKKKYQVPVFRLTILMLSLCAVHSSTYAMQALDDHSMRSVDGQDGIMLDTSYDRIDIDRLYWEDKVGIATGSDIALRAYADNVSITGTNLGTTYSIKTVSDTGKVGLDLGVVSRYGTITAKEFRVCDNLGANCGQSPGGLTIQSQENATLKFNTKDGLFNPSSLSNAEISLKRINIFLSQMENINQPLTTTINQLILKDFNFNFNFKGQGYIYVDAAKGLVLETKSDGYVDLNRVCILDAASCDASGLVLTAANSKPGLNIDLVTKNDTKDTYNASAETKGLIRVGASGRLTNASLTFRGTDGRGSAGETILGKAYSQNNTSTTPDATSVAIMGSTGVAMRMKADFSNASTAGTNATTLELAHGGENAYGLQFGNLSPLITTYNASNQENTSGGIFDSGNVYVNLANTKRMILPVNTTLTNLPFMSGKLAKDTDYNLLVHNAASNTTPNPNAVIIAIRDAKFQAISRQTKFIASADVYTDEVFTNDPTGSGTWGLGLPIYGLDANVAIYGTSFTGTPYNGVAVTNSQRLGFGLGLSTKGISADGTQTTSILLIDGKKYHKSANTAGVRNAYVSGSDTDYNPINYYIGLRNIDMLLSGYGSIGLEAGRVNLYIPEFMLATSGQVAVGYLPGSQYKTLIGGVTKYAPTNSFLSNNDVLFGLRLRMGGSVDMAMIPGGNSIDSNYISFTGNLGLTSGAVQLVEPTDGSIVGFDNISGKLGFNNKIKINKENVDFEAALNFNPNSQAADVLRIKDLNLYPATFTNGLPTGVGNAQRLGEMVITGGKITSQFNITPH